MQILNNVKLVLYLGGVLFIAGIIYTFHYKPIQELKERQATCRSLNEEQALIIKNLRVELRKAGANLISEKSTTEICVAEIENCYEEINSMADAENQETIKDTSDEGYLKF